MCRSNALIGLNNTRTSASPVAKDGVEISSSFNTLFGSPVSRKINAFINTSRVFATAPHATSRMTFHLETGHHWYPQTEWEILLYERYRAPNWKSEHSSP